MIRRLGRLSRFQKEKFVFLLSENLPNLPNLRITIL